MSHECSFIKKNLYLYIYLYLGPKFESRLPKCVLGGVKHIKLKQAFK